MEINNFFNFNQLVKKEDTDMCADGRSVDITNLYPKLVDAVNACYQTGSLGPIIKEELKLKIQTSRLAAGKKELPKPVFKEPEKSPLTEDEEKRNEVRRERNRIAASKCRNKQKQVKMEKLTEVMMLEKQQRELKTMVHDKELEKEELIRKLLERNIQVPSDIMATIQQQWPPVQSEPLHSSSRKCPTPVSPFLTSPSPGLDLQAPSATSPFHTPSPCFFQPPLPQYMPQTSPSPSFLAYLSQTCTEDIEKAFMHGPDLDDVENVFRHGPKQDDIENGFLHGPKQPEIMEQATSPDAPNVFPAVHIPHAICPSPPPNDSVKLLHFGDLRENLYTQQEHDVDIDLLGFLDETSLYTA